jgi:hypothetical protein
MFDTGDEAIAMIENKMFLIDSLNPPSDSILVYIYIDSSNEGSYKLVLNGIPQDRVDSRLMRLVASTNRFIPTSRGAIPIVFSGDNMAFIREGWRLPMFGFYIDVGFNGTVLGTGVLY